MKIALADIETTALPEADHFHCGVVKRLDTGKTTVYTDLHKMMKENQGVRWVFHNGLGFDGPKINQLLGYKAINLTKILDTFVISRLVNYKRFRTHGLKEWGLHLKVMKDDYTGDFAELTQDMIDYCIQDVVVLEAVWKELEPYVMDPKWAKAMRLEHDTAIMAQAMSNTGFKFNIAKAESMLTEVEGEMKVLEDSFLLSFPPKLVETKRIKMRYKKDGKLFAPVLKAMAEAPKVEQDEETGELVCFGYKSFNPASPRQRVDALWDAKWKPTVKTAGHKKFLRDKRREGIVDKDREAIFKRYGWMCNEENLNTLPSSAPKAGRDLAQWLTLEGRRSSLAEWLGVVNRTDERIHGRFWHIGSWTGRMSHTHPNAANIASPFHGQPKTPVEDIKARYDADMRALWMVEDGNLLVGTDAAGIQLRILAHYMKSEAYRSAILDGNKDDGTDIHNLNRKALGHVCKDRDTAKTFIYAWLLGASIPKIAEILSCSIPKASKAVDNFLAALPELNRVKSLLIPKDAARGYFIGLDGRKVKCDSEHLMLAGYLQSGESIIMKRWIIEWKKLADVQRIKYKLVDFVHDETQVEVPNMEEAEKLQRVQKIAMDSLTKDLDLFCPMDVESDIGENWRETH